MDEVIFDTRYAGDGFDFESIDFPQGKAVAVEAWLARAGLSHVVTLVYEPGVAFFRSRRRFETRDDAERAMSRLLRVLKHVRESDAALALAQRPRRVRFH